ncbi:hypothetical protein OV079_28085 [Nannocystis pusilla]|uniref:Uncharacterized protein n=1 Tax=Nannocystis pusilla TaxID=889268 RepID=A0A9X3IZB3_9BACT|nr:hypothetical protein [Nannocystis pusilla]MCY1009356.1 hypothetical protein [Nannocystis pusilla]
MPMSGAPISVTSIVSAPLPVAPRSRMHASKAARKASLGRAGVGAGRGSAGSP